MMHVRWGRVHVAACDVPTCGRADVRRAWEAVIVAGVVRVAVRLLPLPRVLALLGRLPRGGRLGDAEGCVTAAGQGTARVAHATCLYRSLVAFAMLARRGVPVVFHLGARKGGPFAAHAWLSVAGHVVGDAPRGWAELWRHGAADTTRT